MWTNLGGALQRLSLARHEVQQVSPYPATALMMCKCKRRSTLLGLPHDFVLLIPPLYTPVAADLDAPQPPRL